MEKKSERNILLALRQTNALSGTPKLFFQVAESFLNDSNKVHIFSESLHPNFLKNNFITKRAWKWPKNSIRQRNLFSWQADQYQKKLKNSLVIGHGDTLNQDILFLHTCVHLASELNPSDHKKNMSIPFHQKIFKEGRFKVIICNSKMMEEDIKKRFRLTCPTYVLYPGRNETLPNLVNPTAVKELRDRVLKQNKNNLILGVVTSGNLNNRGAYELIKAVGLLDIELKNKISLLIVGKEKHSEKLFDLATENGVSHEQLTWMNPIDNVADVIQVCDLIIHAAKMEAFGMSVLESMSLGKPIVATKTVGCSELFGEKQQGYIIEKQDKVLIKEKIENLLTNPVKLNELGDENLQHSRPYTWKKYINQFQEILKKEFS